MFTPQKPIIRRAAFAAFHGDCEPKGRGESLLFAMSESGGGSGESYRLTRRSNNTFTRTHEVAIADLMSQYLDGNPVLSVCAAYNCFFPVTIPLPARQCICSGLRPGSADTSSPRGKATKMVVSMPAAWWESAMSKGVTG